MTLDTHNVSYDILVQAISNGEKAFRASCEKLDVHFPFDPHVSYALSDFISDKQNLEMCFSGGEITHEWAERVWNFLRGLRKELIEASHMTREGINAVSLSRQPNLVKFIVSAFVFKASTRAVCYAEKVENTRSSADSMLKNLYEGYLEEARENLALAHHFEEQALSSKKLNDDHIAALLENTYALPGVLACYAHDISQVLVGKNGEFSFSDARIPNHHADDWQRARFDARSAGYWLAYGIGPKEALKWRSLGLSPEVAFQWKYRGFSADQATREAYNEAA